MTDQYEVTARNKMRQLREKGAYDRASVHGVLDAGLHASVAFVQDGKPVVLNFFASWCAPCIRELPDFQEAFVQYGDEVEFIGLSVSDREADTVALLEETGVAYLIGLDPEGAIHREVAELGVMPTTAFVGADGTLVAVNAGIISGEDLEQRIVEELLP